MTDDPRDEAFEDELKKLQDVADGLDVPRLPESEQAAFDERMADLEKRATEAKIAREAKRVEVQRTLKSDQDSAKGLGIGLAIAYTMIGLPIFGYGVGYFVDQSSGGTQAKGIGVLIGSILGIFMAVVILNRHGK